MKSDGSRCKCFAVADSEFCFWHDPSHVSDRILAASRGGRTTMGGKILPEAEFKLRDLEGVRGFLETLANSVVTGKLGTRETQAASYIAATLVRVLESIGLEERVKALEGQMKGKLISENK